MPPQPELAGATERFLIDANARDKDHRDMALNAAAGATAAATDLIEALRGTTPLADNLRHREAAENLADALRSTLAIRIEGDSEALSTALSRKTENTALLAAVQEFLEGWGE